MTKTTSCTIRLLNHSYDIKCAEHEVESLKLAALKLNQHLVTIRKQHKRLDDFQTLLLGALHVSFELIQSESKQEQRQRQLTQLLHSLENKIN